MQNFVQPGLNITVVAPYDALVGGGMKVGNIFGVVADNPTPYAVAGYFGTVKSGTLCTLQVVGVVDIAKDASTFSSGDPVFWNDTAKQATSSTSGNMLVGYAVLALPDGTSTPGGLTGDATVRTRLNASFPGSTDIVVPLTAANLIAMNATPVSVLAAPGAGKAVVVEQIEFEMIAGGVAFTGGGAVSVEYTGGSVVVHAGSVPATVVTGAVGTTLTALGPATGANGITVAANTGLSITNATAAFAAGNGTAKLLIKYRVVTL